MFKSSNINVHNSVTHAMNLFIECKLPLSYMSFLLLYTFCALFTAMCLMERHGYISYVRDPFESRVDIYEVRPEFVS